VKTSSINILVKNLFILLSGAIIYVLSVYKFGLGITDDSINYLSAASSFPPNFLKTNGTPFVEWPPLYPVILSLYKITGISVAGFAGIINGIAFILNLFLASKLLYAVIKSKYIYYTALLFLLFSVPLLQSHVFIWSEGVFILLLLLTLSAMVKYLDTDKYIYFIILIFLSILMSLQRKTGLFFTINFGIILFTLSKDKSFIKKIICTSLYISISTLPFILWTFRKYTILGRVFESAFLKPEKIILNIKQLLNVLSSWVIPAEISLDIRLSVIVFAGISIIILLVKSSTQFKEIFNSTLIKVSFISFVGYLLLLPIVFIYIQGENIDDRILSPVYILVFMFLFLFLDNIIALLSYRYLLKKSILVIITLSLCYPVLRTIYHIKKWNTYGTGGYNSIGLRNNKMIKWLKENETSEPVMSNNEYLVNYYLNYASVPQRRIIHANIPVKEKRFLLVCFASPLNKDINFNYLTNGKVLYKSNEGTISLIKR
jgi:hypothetical protein